MADVSILEDLFYQVLNSETGVDPALMEAVLAESAILTVRIPEPPLNSSISAPYMRAFLDMQAGVNRLALRARLTPRLTNALKKELELNVVVTDGSSQFKLDLTEVLKKAVGQMTGRQVALTILGVSLLAGCAWGATTWMEGQRQVQLEQIKSAEHIKALDALSFATSKDIEERERLIDALQKNVDLGHEVVEFANEAMREVVKASTSTKEAEINGQPISRDVADLLTLSPRSQTEVNQQQITARVIDINTEDLVRPSIEMQDVDTGQKFRFTMDDDLFAADQRAKLFQALETGGSIEVTVEITSTEDGIRGVKFVNLPNDP